MSQPTPTLADRLTAAALRIESAGVAADEARQSAWVLAAHASGLDRAGLVVRLREPPPVAFDETFEPLVARRAAREPVAYITGEREFYGRMFRVTRDVLIPRPETELVIEEALKALQAAKSPLIVDVGTGSGCIAITLAMESPSARLVATETSVAALEIARANAVRLGVAGRVEFRLGAYLAGMTGPIDFIVSNPPYVPETDRPSLTPEVQAFEPASALFAGSDGLDAIRALVPAAARALAPHGRLILEIGHGQIDGVRQIIAASECLAVERVRLDLQRIPRVVVASGSGAPRDRSDV